MKNRMFRPRRDPDPTASERGDVPGWVLVTLMTAGLVIAIWAVAGPALIDVFNTAISRITSI
ncbi:MAG: hypothetical protein ACTHW1_07600 [Ancrocorticia sp.]|uniref:hypothetical protein n=1 Tax=Ancrocorticia sp. TaxID=2593684 RepID=UPI003F90896D